LIYHVNEIPERKESNPSQQHEAAARAITPQTTNEKTAAVFPAATSLFD
jgi:hypothetical protein